MTQEFHFAGHGRCGERHFFGGLGGDHSRGNETWRREAVLFRQFVDEFQRDGFAFLDVYFGGLPDFFVADFFSREGDDVRSGGSVSDRPGPDRKGSQNDKIVECLSIRSTASFLSASSPTQQVGQNAAFGPSLIKKGLTATLMLIL